MQFELLTINGAKFSGKAQEVVVDTAAGAIAVYANHEPLTTIVIPGSVVVRSESGKTETFATFGGLLEFENNVCRLLSDDAEHSDDLVEKEIADALAQAERLKVDAKDKHELHTAQTLIDRHTVRLNVAKMKRRHHDRDQK